MTRRRAPAADPEDGATGNGKALPRATAAARARLQEGRFGNARVAAGDRVQADVKLSETVSHEPMRIPVTVVRATEPGPALFVTSAIHGDEINGTAMVQRLLDGIERRLTRGIVVAVPVANRFGFDTQDRYLPDRRDLNRAFPGDADGHMAARIADVLFKRVVLPCDAGVDLHTAAIGHTNLCHIRGDGGHPGVRALADAFGTPVVVHGEGPKGSLRRAATEAGIPTILFEAGEPGRFQRHVVDVGLDGLRRLLAHLGMSADAPPRPAFQAWVGEAEWLRSGHGGILDLEVEPGDLVRAGDRVGTLQEPLGRHVDKVEATRSGVVLGTCTTPLVFPGMAIAHVGELPDLEAAEAHVRSGGDLGHLAPRTVPSRRPA